MNHFLHPLVEQIDPQLTIAIGQSWCPSKVICAVFLHRYYEWLKWCYFLPNATYNQLVLTIAYLIAPLHSLVDGSRILNRRHLKKGVTLRPRYLVLISQIGTTTMENICANSNWYKPICLFILMT